MSAGEFLDVLAESMNESEIENNYLMVDGGAVRKENKGLYKHKMDRGRGGTKVPDKSKAEVCKKHLGQEQISNWMVVYRR